jgi:hypothetical protein
MRGTPIDPHLRYPWQQTVLEALVEYPPLRNKIEAAEGAISSRLCEKPTEAQELLALRDAVFALRIVFPETAPIAESAETSEITM